MTIKTEKFFGENPKLDTGIKGFTKGKTEKILAVQTEEGVYEFDFEKQASETSMTGSIALYKPYQDLSGYTLVKVVCDTLKPLVCVEDFTDGVKFLCDRDKLIAEKKNESSDIKQTITIQDENGVHEFELKKPKYELPDPTNRHYKFVKYCQSIGYPDIEFTLGGKPPILWGKCTSCVTWESCIYYRIANDPHHELRREWIDSDFTLPIELLFQGEEWIRSEEPDWNPLSQYCNAEKPLLLNYIEQDYVVMTHNVNHGVGYICRINETSKPCVTPDGKYLIGFKGGHAHILPVERGDTQLGINPEMDKLVRDNGLGHWKCSSSELNAWWERDDGESVMIVPCDPSNNEIINALKMADKQRPRPLKG